MNNEATTQKFSADRSWSSIYFLNPSYSIPPPFKIGWMVDVLPIYYMVAPSDFIAN